MKIQYALMSCNANPLYTQYWPAVAAAWLKLGIIPVCLFIPDSPSSKLPEVPAGSIVHTTPPLNDVHIIIQALMLRFWACYLYRDAVVITSNMDLAPLSNHFFHTQLAPYPDHAYLHLNPFQAHYPFTHMADIPEKTTHIHKIRYLQSWFHVAKGETMYRVLQLSPDWKTTCRKIRPYSLHKETQITIGRYSWQSHRAPGPWFGDEIYTSIRLHQSSYHPVYYISYPFNLYLDGLMHRTALFYPNINSVRDRHVGIYFPGAPHPEDRKVLELLLDHRTTPTFVRRYIRFCSWLVNVPDVPKAKANLIRTWIVLTLIILIWCILHILPTPRPYNRLLLIHLWWKRYDLLSEHPWMRHFLRSR